MSVITCDFETFWSSKDYTLSKIGPIQYIRDPKFHAQLLGWRVDKGPVQVCEHEDIPAVLAALHLDDPNNITVAHNGNGFDFLILSEIYGIVPANTLDTIDMMRWVGLSSVIGESHASLTAHLKTGTKRQGTVISDGKHWPQDFTPEEREAFKLYCKQDVYQCSENCFRLLPLITEDMLKFDSLTMRMACDPKLMVDVPALREYDAQLQAQVEKARRDLMHLFHFENVEEFQKSIRSADKFCAMLRQLGAEPPMKLSEKKSETKKAKLEAEGVDTSDPASWEVYAPALSKQDREFVEMQECGDERVELLVRTRLENNSSIQQSRVKTFLKMGEYWKPVPVLLKAFGAHTGRYAAGSTEGKSEGLNWQNLSKRNPAMLPLRQAIKVPAGYKLVSCDSSQVEARVLAYVANQTDMLQLFAQREDVYADFGEIISGGIPAKEIHDGAKSGDKKLKALRNISKTIILGCLGADTKVLTDNGWKSIVAVSETDRLWDGEQWVNHGGVIFSGVKQTMDVAGAQMTPEHRIFDGSSWRTAAECGKQPHYLSSALSFAASKFATFSIEKAHMHTHESMLSYAYPAEILAQLTSVVCFLVKKVGVKIARTLDYKTGRGLNRANDMGISQLFVGSAAGQRAAAQNAQYYVNATAARNPIGYHYQISNWENQHVAINAQREKGTKLSEGNILPMLIFAKTLPQGSACLTGLTPVCNAAIIQQVSITATMGHAVLNASSKTRESFYHILSHLMDMINQILNLTVSTMTGTTNEGTCTSLLTQKTCATKGVLQTIKNFIGSKLIELKNWRKKSKDYERVYDIMNSGPNNRFMIMTNAGPLLVHNCGYGTSPAKAAHTMWMQGQKQNDDYSKHAEIVKSYIQMYRQKNSAITYFWKVCQGVIENLAMGGSGGFGGPDNALFRYGSALLPELDTPVPSIWLPNGYALRYPGLAAGMNDKGKAEYTYKLRRGKVDVPHRLYGSACTENLVQSLAFALLIYQACRMSDVGIKLCCNIHDSFSTVVEERAAEDTAIDMIDIMRTLPPWLAGCPIDAEAEITDDFTGA